MNKIISLFVLIFTSVLSHAQNVKIAEPEFSGTIVLVNGTSPGGLPLETAKLILKTKASASVYVTGIGKATTKATVKGSTSTVKTKRDSSLQFVYRAADNTVNPVDVIQLIRFNVKGGNRETVLASAGTFSGASTGDVGFVPFTAKKYKTSSYLITVSNLATGEYGFSLGKEETTTIHMFTVE
jgi:hypothetical protein